MMTERETVVYIALRVYGRFISSAVNFRYACKGDLLL